MRARARGRTVEQDDLYTESLAQAMKRDPNRGSYDERWPSTVVLPLSQQSKAAASRGEGLERNALACISRRHGRYDVKLKG